MEIALFILAVLLLIIAALIVCKVYIDFRSKKWPILVNGVLGSLLKNPNCRRSALASAWKTEGYFGWEVTSILDGLEKNGFIRTKKGTEADPEYQLTPEGYQEAVKAYPELIREYYDPNPYPPPDTA